MFGCALAIHRLVKNHSGAFVEHTQTPTGFKCTSKWKGRKRPFHEKNHSCYHPIEDCQAWGVYEFLSRMYSQLGCLGFS
jgi:hypothetical protein